MQTHSWMPQSFHRYVRTIESSSRTAYIYTDAGPAYLKAINNPEGPHILACDWLGTQLAQRFGLQTFDVAILPLTDLDEIPLDEQVTAVEGPAYVARAENGTTMWNAEMLKRIENAVDIPRIVIFDTWVRNCDRYSPRHWPTGTARINPDNLFLSEEGSESGTFVLKAIDHGHILTCGRQLTTTLGTIGNVREEKLYGLFPEFRSHVTLEQLDEVASELGHVQPTLWDDLLQRIPDVWGVTQDIRRAISGFLLDRARFLSNHLHDIAHAELHPGMLNFGSQNGGHQ